MDDDRVMRIIKARCGDVLSDADLASIEARFPPAEPDLPVETMGIVLDVIDQMEARMMALEFACGQTSEPAGL